MTVEEIKTLLNEKCEESWQILKAMENVYSKNSVQVEKQITKWVTYDDLFLELFNERPHYDDDLNSAIL